LKRTLPWLTLAAVFAGMLLALRLQGRLWVCACGYILLWLGNINSSDNSQHLFDAYSFTHIIHGFLFIGIASLLWPKLDAAWRITIAVSAGMLWEAIENSTFVINRYRAETISIGYVGDTILNSTGDVLACLLGIIIARRLGVVRTLIVGCAIELILLFTIHDNLLLNIIMLFHPFEGIRAWQAGH